MKLKSLELQGFKSFPDKTVLQFTSGVTAVLGPNGSGKSNISDAVRWVLGELSSKNLRGSKMEDVIFGGSDTRRPMGYAEVTLVLDNTEGTGRLASDFDEVTVTRRYFRSGSSEYLINRRPVRLRDVNELFLNTGLGKSGYSIIGQGKIAEIISQKSEDRRHIFEEAAGIAKYRYQKADAEKKLTEVDENCRNLSGILGELTKRVAHLEKESEKARIYLDLFGEKKQLDVTLWLSDNDSLRARYEEAQKQFFSAKIGLDAADSETAEYERQEERLLAAMQDCKARIDENEKALFAIRSKSRDLESAARVLENDLRHDSETLEKTRTEHRIRSEALTAEEKRGAEQATLLAERQALACETEARGAALEAKLASLRETIEKLELARIENEAKRTAQQEKIASLNLRLSSLEGSHKTDDSRISGLTAQTEALEQEQKTVSERMKKAQTAMEQYGSMIEALEATLRDAEAKITALREQGEQSRSTQNRLSAELSAKRQRADALHRMDELFEGYAQSVRFLMNAAENGKLQGICGPVAKLIRVEPRFTLAIETALGANLQNVVVENEDRAKAAIALLKKNNAGRCTFYPITSVRPSSLNLSPTELRTWRGFLGVADMLCSCEDRYKSILSSMLGRTLVFDDLDNATAVAKSTSYRYRMVTLDGQIINAGGSFTGGSSRRESGMLTRSSEIESLRAEANAAAKALGEEKTALEKINAAIAEIAQSTEADRGQKNLLSTLLGAEKTQYEVLRAQNETVGNRIADLNRDREALGKEKQTYHLTHTALTQELEALGQALQALEEEASRLSIAYGEADDALAAANADLHALQIEKARHDKDLEVTLQAIAFGKATADALRTQIADAETQIERLLEKQIQTRRAIEENSAGSADLGEEETALSEVGRALIAESLRLEQKQASLRDTMREKAHVREVLFRDYTKLENSVGQMKSDLDTMATRLWEEYELTYSTAKELNYPPLTEQERPALTARREELRLKIKKLGSVNPASIEEYTTEKERCDFLTAQLGDLTASRENLSGIVKGLEKEMHARFIEAINTIGTHFRAIFRELFGGGSAEIRLTDPENALECGIEINAAPPGKIIKSMTLLSGGEQAFTAIALIFAILKVNPTPFCIFDEIEAALDEVNVGHFAEYMHRYSDSTQFIVITHRRGTMEAADRIYGISMPERGISKVLGMNVGEIEAKLGVNLN